MMINCRRWWARPGLGASLITQRFHNPGLIETKRDRFLTIKETKLTAYLAQIGYVLEVADSQSDCSRSDGIECGSGPKGPNAMECEEEEAVLLNLREEIWSA